MPGEMMRGFMRGYFGIGIENGKTVANIGTLWRSAHNLGPYLKERLTD